MQNCTSAVTGIATSGAREMPQPIFSAYAGYLYFSYDIGLYENHANESITCNICSPKITHFYVYANEQKHYWGVICVPGMYVWIDSTFQLTSRVIFTRFCRYQPQEQYLKPSAFHKPWILQIQNSFQFFACQLFNVENAVSFILTGSTAGAKHSKSLVFYKLQK